MIEESEKQKKIADGYQYFEIKVKEGIVPLFFKETWLSGITGHIEFYSNLVSESGFRSHFFYPDELKKFYGNKIKFLEHVIQGLIEEHKVWSVKNHAKLVAESQPALL